MAFLGQDPVRCKIVVDNKCLHVWNLEHLFSKFRMKMYRIFNKNYQIFLKYWEFLRTLLNRLKSRYF
jgi:hypothetical protein